MTRLENALRNTWEDQSHIFFASESGEATPQKVREFLQAFLDSEAAEDLVITRFWRPLVPAHREQALSAAFPDGMSFPLA